MKKLLVLAAGLLQIPIIEKARSLGYYVIAADGSPSAPGLSLADKAVVANITSEEEMLAIAKAENVDGVIHPCSEVAMNVMGRINDDLGLCGIGRETAIRATNKHLMRKAFEEYGAPSPWSSCFADADEAWALYVEADIRDMILKPSRNSGSRGITKISKGLSKDLFVDLFERSKAESRDKTVMLEQFVEGPEFSVEIIVWNKVPNILAVTDKKTTGAPYFVELGHNQPSCYSEADVTVIKDAAYKGVMALGLDNCAAHAEIKLQDGKAYIMEIGARLGGDFISTELTHLSTGIDMVAAAINVALGKEPNLNPQEEKHGVCIRYFCPEAGRLVTISGTDCLTNDPSVYDCEIYCHEGDMIREVKSSTDRSGHVIVIRDTVDDAIFRAEEILKEIKFNTDKYESACI